MAGAVDDVEPQLSRILFIRGQQIRFDSGRWQIDRKVDARLDQNAMNITLIAILDQPELLQKGIPRFLNCSHGWLRPIMPNIVAPQGAIVAEKIATQGVG